MCQRAERTAGTRTAAYRGRHHRNDALGNARRLHLAHGLHRHLFHPDRQPARRRTPGRHGHMQFVPHGQSASFRHHHCRGISRRSARFGRLYRRHERCLYPMHVPDSRHIRPVPRLPAHVERDLLQRTGHPCDPGHRHGRRRDRTADGVPPAVRRRRAAPGELHPGGRRTRHSATRTWGCATAFNPKRGRAPTRTCVWYAPPPTPPDARSPKRASTACGAATCRSIPKR